MSPIGLSRKRTSTRDRGGSPPAAAPVVDHTQTGVTAAVRIGRRPGAGSLSPLGGGACSVSRLERPAPIDCAPAVVAMVATAPTAVNTGAVTVVGS